MRTPRAWHRAGVSVDSRFQDHVLRLRGGGGIDGALIAALRPLLRTKLRARGLWLRPPSFLDYPELRDWRDDGDLEILAIDAASEVIVGRLRGLCARIDVGDNVDGFIALNVESFLGDRQRAADPVGAATYRALLRVVEEHPAISRVDDGSARPAEARTVTGRELADFAAGYARWSVLIGALGRGGAEASDEVRPFCDALTARGAVAIDLGELVTLLRAPARTWQEAVCADEAGLHDDSASRLVRSLGSRQLLAHLEAKIDALDVQTRVRADLRRVLDGWRRAFEDGEDLSQAELADRLGMKKATVSDYVRRLRALIREIEPDETGDGSLP